MVDKKSFISIFITFLIVLGGVFFFKEITGNVLLDLDLQGNASSISFLPFALIALIFVALIIVFIRKKYL